MSNSPRNDIVRVSAAALLVLVLTVSCLALPALAAPLAQLTPFPTPTPGPDGRIVYIVQADDTLLRISLISGVPLDQLRGLNNLTGDNILQGQELLLGLGGPSQPTPTPGPSPTPTPLLPTPSPKPGAGTLCVILYEDVNGDSIRQEEEPSIPGGALSISGRDASQTIETGGGDEPHCFTELLEGNYTISVAAPEGYNFTTVTNYALRLNAGDETFVDFGAQVNSVTAAEAPTPTGSGRSPLLGVIGGVLLLLGAGLAFFASRLLRGK